MPSSTGSAALTGRCRVIGIGFSILIAIADLFIVLYVVWALVVLVPAIAVGVRRLHDTDKSGWFLLVVLVPLVGPIVLLVLFLIDSTPGTNQYGTSEKYPNA